MRCDPPRIRWAAAYRVIELLGMATIRPMHVQNPSVVCRGYETTKPACLTAAAWIKPQTPTRRGFRLMPVLHSVKVLAVNQTIETSSRIGQAVRG